MAENETCVACGEPIVVGGEQATDIEVGLIHESCYRIGVDVLFSGKYDALTNEEARAIIRIRALKKAGSGEGAARCDSAHTSATSASSTSRGGKWSG